MDPRFEKIRRMITANHGGLSGATNSQIMTIWRSLPAGTKKLYEDKDKGSKKNAVGN